MIEDLASQYDEFSAKFIAGTNIYNDLSRKLYYEMLNINFRNKKLLDVGCGDGYDLVRFQKLGAKVYGIDASKELVKIAKEHLPKEHIQLGLMEKLPYANEFFDAVISKYVLQTSTNVPLVLKEMDRVLKVGGTLAYLAVHPLRQFLEKKKHPKSYFTQEIVESIFANGTVTAREPTHSFNEYFNPEFLRKYKITHFKEEEDFPSSEKVDGDTYPCFFVLKAEKIIK
ncbi:MAG: class I SAM-dependent methyltransferase [Candidatus Nanoarchaeia archaeon]